MLEDAEAGRDWLVQRTGTKPSDLVLFGESLGGAVAVHLASTGGSRFDPGKHFLQHAQRRCLSLSVATSGMLMRSKFESASKIKSYRGPLLQIHGDSDTIVPIEFCRRLFDCDAEPKRLLVVPGGDHNDERSVQARTAIGEFLESLPAIGE